MNIISHKIIPGKAIKKSGVITYLNIIHYCETEELPKLYINYIFIINHK